MITLPYGKIENIPPTDGERPAIGDVWYDAENKRLVAADGFILAVVPVEAQDSDVGGHVPLEAIREARRAFRGRPYLELAESRATCPFAEGEVWERPVHLPFPDYAQVVPEPGEGYVTLALDARRLMTLAEALCEDEDGGKRAGGRKPDVFGVVLIFKPDGCSPVLVRPVSEPNKPRGRFGVIAPMRNLNRKG